MKLSLGLLGLAALSLSGSVVGCGGSGEDATTGDEADVNALHEAFSQSCTLTKLHDDGVFEESLSMEEYPDVSVERDGRTGVITVSIGSSVYSSSNHEMTVTLVTSEPVPAVVGTTKNGLRGRFTTPSPE